MKQLVALIAAAVVAVGFTSAAVAGAGCFSGSSSKTASTVPDQGPGSEQTAQTGTRSGG